ncbi:MAG TPA: NADH-quinone oxidoreductase subunit NuoH [Bdellovibrionota bacterium]|nr:NADH-quinone oxidoreductase subunit NuoH [Bdellovibrionota bacterium]
MPINIEARSWEAITLSQKASEALPENPWQTFWLILLGLVGLVLFLTILAIVLIYVERKIAAHFQCRLGPMRVGWHGVLQTIADVFKLLFKEDIVPERADKFLHLLGPILAMLASILMLGILPYSPLVQLFDLNVGVVFVIAVSGFGVLGMLIGGWSSNNKWSLLGAMRAGAQIVSYEISVILATLVVVSFSGTLKLNEIVLSQSDGWWIWRGHIVGVVAFLLFFISSTAELNRVPFDLAEGESELTAGYHTEYSGIRFAFYFLAEFLNLFVVAALATTFFFGGWMPFHILGLDSFNAIMDVFPPVLWFSVKSALLIFLLMWFRWTFPRLRVDQLMRLEWKVLLPIGFFNLLAASILVLFGYYFFPSVG